ncbi:MAG: leucine-rich repeat domain-containing protein [Leptolyngbyaceae cyanobacterium SL_5_14]|nr:leucine-rich repeat domain-containing protein [Leptolyngbyaceae cyanobacterium SL_5_14]NJO66879.1 leucine-rich repeat domain-containing protein [Leptolyngbyaceae cyanobacterium RM1_405_57]
MLFNQFQYHLPRTFWKAIALCLWLAMLPISNQAKAAQPRPQLREYQSFVELCRHQEELSGDARRVVYAVFLSLGTDNCDRANENLANVTDLSLGYLSFTTTEYLTDLEALQTLPNLRELSIIVDYTADLSPLRSLTHLTKLRIECFGQLPDAPHEIDINSLQFLEQLEILEVQCNVADSGPLSSLSNLTELSLAGEIPNLNSLQSLTSLQKLSVFTDGVSDLSPLRSLTNLTELTLSSNEISDLSPLSSLTNLTDLYLSSEQISDITALQTLTNLKSLTLTTTQVSDTEPIQSLENLTELSLSRNQILDVSALQGLTNLTELDLMITRFQISVHYST